MKPFTYRRCGKGGATEENLEQNLEELQCLMTRTAIRPRSVQRGALLMSRGDSIRRRSSHAKYCKNVEAELYLWGVVTFTKGTG